MAAKLALSAVGKSDDTANYRRPSLRDVPSDLRRIGDCMS